jgi:hypothetical protein
MIRFVGSDYCALISPMALPFLERAFGEIRLLQEMASFVWTTCLKEDSSYRKLEKEVYHSGGLVLHL